MNTELYILYISNPAAPVLNTDFSDGFQYWDSATIGELYTRYNACYNVGGNANTLFQDNIITTGATGITYEVSWKIVPSLDYSPITGSLSVSLGADIINFASIGIGNHKCYITTTDDPSTNQSALIFWYDATFNGGITQMSVKKISGTWLQLDLIEDLSIGFNSSIVDVRDITKRGSGYSSTIKLSGSKTNNQIFKNLFNISETGSFEMGIPFDCRVIQDSLVVFEGSFQLNQCNIFYGIEYEASIYSKINDFYNNISGKYLRGNDDFTKDISFSEYRHQLTLSNVAASFFQSTGYTYILIDKGEFLESKIENGVLKLGNAQPHFDFDERLSGATFSITDLTPSIFIKDIWDKIFYDAGFTYESTFLNDTYFSHLIYPHTDKTYYISEREKSDRGGLVSSANTFSSSSVTETFNLTWNTVDVAPILNSFNSSYAYLINEPGNYNIELNIDFSNYLDFGIDLSSSTIYVYPVLKNPKNTIVIKKYDNTTGSILEIYREDFDLDIPWKQNTIGSGFVKLKKLTTDTNGIFTGVSYSINFKNDNILTLKQDDRIWVDLEFKNDLYYFTTIYSITNSNVISVNSISGETTTPTLYFEPSISNFKLISIDGVVEGQTIDPSTILHEKVNQVDFINSITKMFNLYIEDRGDKNLIIEPRNQYYELTHNTYYWNDKISISNEYTIEPGSDLITKYIDFHYIEDTDHFNQLYKDTNNTNKMYGQYWSRGLYNRDTEDKYEIKTIFAPTIVGPVYVSQDYNKINTIEIPKIYTFDSSGNYVDIKKKYKPRILYWGGLITPSRNEIWYIRHSEYIEPAQIHNNNTPTLKYTDYPVNKFPLASTLDTYYGIPSGSSNDLNWWVCESYWMHVDSAITNKNLVYKYYYDEINELLDPDTKILTAYFNLKPNDIYRLRFNDVIMVQNQPYHINKIEYSYGELSRLELVKSNKSYIDNFNKWIVNQTATKITNPVSIGSNFSVEKPVSIVTGKKQNLINFNGVITEYNSANIGLIKIER